MKENEGKVRVTYKTKCRNCGKIEQYPIYMVSLDMYEVFADWMREKMATFEIKYCECLEENVAHDTISYSKRPELPAE